MNLLAKLRNLTELELIELLDLTSDDIVDAFLDRIEEKSEYLFEQVSDLKLNGYEEE